MNDFVKKSLPNYLREDPSPGDLIVNEKFLWAIQTKCIPGFVANPVLWADDFQLRKNGLPLDISRGYLLEHMDTNWAEDALLFGLNGSKGVESFVVHGGVTTVSLLDGSILSLFPDEMVDEDESGDYIFDDIVDEFCTLTLPDFLPDEVEAALRGDPLLFSSLYHFMEQVEDSPKGRILFLKFTDPMVLESHQENLDTLKTAAGDVIELAAAKTTVLGFCFDGMLPFCLYELPKKEE